MKSYLLFAFLALTGCKTAEAPNLTIMGGQRDYSEQSDWEQTDRQEAWGIQIDAAARDGFGPEFGLIWSSDDSGDDRYVNRSTDETRTSVREVYLGARKNFMVTDWLQMHVTGGVSLVRVETAVDLSYTSDTPEDSSQELTPYLGIGGNAFVTKELAVGIQYRRNFWGEDSDIFMHNPDLDGDLVLLTLTYSF